MSVLKVEGLQKQFHIERQGKLFARNEKMTVHAVEGVSFSVNAGEVLTIVGESGCGKSTVARMLVGTVPQSAGTVTIGDRVMPANRTAADRKLIQLVAQNPWAALNRRRTIGHALEQPLRANNIGDNTAERRDMVLQMLERVGLTPAYLDSRPGDVSGGELARAVLARALLLSPKVLVLDEPTASLDASVKATVVNLLMSLCSQLDLSMVLITHEISVARMIADQAAVMYLGRFVEKGPAEDVFNRPDHPYVRMLMDSVPSADPRERGLGDPKGEVPSAVAPPRGCAYHPRCDVVMDVCPQLRPELLPHENREVACHHYTDLGMPTVGPVESLEPQLILEDK